MIESPAAMTWKEGTRPPRSFMYVLRKLDTVRGLEFEAMSVHTARFETALDTFFLLSTESSWDDCHYIMNIETVFLLKML